MAIERIHATIISEINSTHPDILFVGMGSPRQEVWVSRNLENLNVRICHCVGGAIDVLAGKVKRAPTLVRR